MSQNAIVDVIRDEDLADEALDRADLGKACGNYSGLSTPTSCKVDRP